MLLGGLPNHSVEKMLLWVWCSLLATMPAMSTATMMAPEIAP